MKILLFGGTTEGRVLAQKLLALGHAVTVSVATALGAEMLGDFPKDHILTGRLEQPAIARRLPDYALCIDATHPYAVEVTKNIQAACEATGTPLRRLLRQESATEATWVTVESTEQAAAWPPRGSIPASCPPTRRWTPARPWGFPTRIFWPYRGRSPGK